MKLWGFLRSKNMAKDIKLMFGVIGATLLLIVGFAVWQARLPAGQGGNEDENVQVAGVQVNNIEVEEDYYNLGNVSIKGGIKTLEYKVKNTEDTSLKLKKIATSCMCTKAKVKVGDKETKFFGMEGHGDKNPPVNLEIGSNMEVLVTVEFDPAAHGPQGVGPFDRIIWLTFSDPAGVKELKFSGTVIN